MAIGEALSDAFDSGLVQREEMFITSKVWCSEVDDVLSAIKRSLRYFLLMLIEAENILSSESFYSVKVTNTVHKLACLSLLTNVWQA